jgi:histidinol phosphatase-like enzyme
MKSIEICSFYHKMVIKLCIITNQAGIARGLYSEKDLSILNDW